MPEPEAKKKDYVWCTGCGAYVFKKFVKKIEPGFFSDEVGKFHCPDGHELEDPDAIPQAS